MKKAILGTVLLGATLWTAPPAVAKNETIIEFQANALAASGAPQPRGGKRSGIINIRITRWSTDEERAELLEAAGQVDGSKQTERVMSRALRKQDRTGTIWAQGQRGYPLRFAREIAGEGGKRTIVVATDRPITFSEIQVGSNARAFDVTVIQLVVDEENNGDGVGMVGAEIIEKDGVVSASSFTSQPVRLGNVRAVN